MTSGPSSSTPGAFDWRVASPDEVEAQYSPSRVALQPIEAHLAAYARASAEAGDPRELAVPGQPLLVYVHGGYWQELSAAESLFAATDARREGVSLVALDYTLAPIATIDAMIEECAAGLAEAISSLCPPSVVLAGSSAGAHLVACCLRRSGVAEAVDGAALLSGIYDLRPLTRTSINRPLGLSAAEALRLSPAFDNFGPLPPVLVATGEHETSEFKRQSHEMAAHLRRDRVSVTQIELSQRDHFDLPHDLLARDTAVGDWILSLLGRAAGTP